MIDNIPPVIGLPLALILWGILAWQLVRTYRAIRREDRDDS